MSEAASSEAAPAQSALPPGWPAMSIQQAHALLTQPGSPLETEDVEIRGVRLKSWKNQPPTLRAVVEHSRSFKDRVFLVYEDERVTFEGFYRAVSALARELQSQGVGKGDRVAVIMRNVPEWVVAFYAAASIGAVVTPLNAWWTGPELEYGLTDSGTKIVLMDAERYERLKEHLGACPDLVRRLLSGPSAPAPSPSR